MGVFILYYLIAIQVLILKIVSEHDTMINWILFVVISRLQQPVYILRVLLKNVLFPKFFLYHNSM